MPAAPRKRPSIHLRVTLAGWLVLAATTVIGVAAFKSESSLLFFIFGGILGAYVLSAFVSRSMVGGVRLRRQVPSRVWQGQTSHVSYHLRNVRRRGTALGLTLEEMPASQLHLASGYCVALPAGSAFQASGRFAVDRRGKLSLPGVQVRTSFPFGLVEAILRIPAAEDVIAWPARGKVTTALLYRGARATLQGKPTKIKGGQDEFYGLREYREGDDPRWIHWRRSATRTEPVVREMTRHRPELLWVVVDLARAGEDESHADDMEYLLRFAASLVDHGPQREYQVGLALVGERNCHVVPAGIGRGTRQQLLDALALAEIAPPRRERPIPRGPGSAIGRRDTQVVLLSATARMPEDFGLVDGPHLTALTPQSLAHYFDDATAPAATDAPEAA